MLTNDLVVTDNSTATKPGSLGAKTYALIGVTDSRSTRRIAATANSTPQTLVVSHEVKGAGYKQRVRTLVGHTHEKVDGDIALTGGVIPSCRVQLVIDRPTSSGGFITPTTIKDQIGAVVDVLCASGQLDKILNQEP